MKKWLYAIGGTVLAAAPAIAVVSCSCSCSQKTTQQKTTQQVPTQSVVQNPQQPVVDTNPQPHVDTNPQQPVVDTNPQPHVDTNPQPPVVDQNPQQPVVDTNPQLPVVDQNPQPAAVDYSVAQFDLTSNVATYTLKEDAFKAIEAALAAIPEGQVKDQKIVDVIFSTHSAAHPANGKLADLIFDHINNPSRVDSDLAQEVSIVNANNQITIKIVYVSARTVDEAKAEISSGLDDSTSLEAGLVGSTERNYFRSVFNLIKEAIKNAK